MGKSTKPCVVCGNPAVVRSPARWHRTKYCSFQCQHDGRKGIQASPATQFKKGQRPANYNGGRFKDKHGYVRALARNHPRANQTGYVFEHILVWEKANGRYLPRDWVVHHINGVKDDNRPENLEGMPRKNHHPALDPGYIKARLRVVEAERNRYQEMYEVLLSRVRSARTLEEVLRFCSGD